MITEETIQNALEDFIITELRKELTRNLEPVIEEVLTKAMQQVVIKLYRNDKMSGINFHVEILPKNQA